MFTGKHDPERPVDALDREARIARIHRIIEAERHLWTDYCRSLPRCF